MTRRLARDQRGVIAVVFALMFPVVAGILGFGVETGIWYTIKRHYQSIADVAAYSGALEIAAIIGGLFPDIRPDYSGPECGQGRRQRQRLPLYRRE